MPVRPLYKSRGRAKQNWTNARHYGLRLKPGHPYAIVTPIVPFPIAKMIGFAHWWIWSYRATLKAWALVALPLMAILGVCAAFRW